MPHILFHLFVLIGKAEASLPVIFLKENVAFLQALWGLKQILLNRTCNQNLSEKVGLWAGVHFLEGYI